MPPQTMKAVVTVEGKQVAVKEVPVPKPGPGEILVKVIAAAQNPTDWKHVHNISGPGFIVGSDFAGVVEEIGPDVPDGLRKKGERVAGFIHGSYSHELGGAFAEYLVINAALVIAIPERMTFEDASTVPLGALTACQMLYQSLELPTTDAPLKDRTPILVWGGASGVGQLVVQLAALTNFQVVATASPANADLVKSIGAEAVFDYKDPQVVSKIKSYTNGKLELAADCLSTETTSRQVSEAMSDEGGSVAVILAVNKEAGLRQDVKFVYSLAYTIFNSPVWQIPSQPEHFAKATEWCKFLSRLLAEERLKPVPTKIFPKGLASVPDGFRYMMEGKVHGEKIVYRISDTP